MNNHFRCIGIVGHPRHPTALTTHEMLYRWLCGKGYEVMVEQQIAQELQLKGVKTGTLAEIARHTLPGEFRHIDADAVIGKRQLHGLFLGQAARGDRDVAALRRVLDRILEEDAHHLTHRSGVRIDDARLIGLEPQRVLLGDELHLAHGIVDELVEMDILLVQDLALLVGAREEQQLLDKVLHVLGL